MKTNKFSVWALLLGLVSIFTLSSCLGDNDDDNTSTIRDLTQLEKQVAISNAAGEYEGFYYFIDDKNKLDSLPTVATISEYDSVMTVTIPRASMRASLMRASADEAKLAIFDQSPSIKLKGVLHPYFNQYWNAGDYTFIYTYANNTVTETFTIDDVDHTVVYKFADYLNSGGYLYNRSAEYYDKKFFCNILLESVTLEGTTYNLLTGMTFEGKRN